MYPFCTFGVVLYMHIVMYICEKRYLVIGYGKLVLGDDPTLSSWSCMHPSPGRGPLGPHPEVRTGGGASQRDPGAGGFAH